MAINIFDKYGLKEVANVSVFALDEDKANDIAAGDIVLYLDTLKVSTIEQTAEQTDATGGWGNPKLISWDYGKEITVTLEDALISPESLRFMMGGALKRAKSDDKVLVHRTEQAKVATEGALPKLKDHLTGEELAPSGPISYINLTTGERGQAVASESGELSAVSDDIPLTYAATAGDMVRVFWMEERVEEDSALEISISPNTFPGTYKFVGETFIRSEKTGKDEPYQFIIPKAKVASEVTLTMEADGDPATFEMTLNVLRSEADDGSYEMFKFVRY